MPIGALSNPTTLEQLQAIGVLPMGGGISSPLPQAFSGFRPQAPLAPPQGPSQPFVSPDGSFVPPQAQPTNAQATQANPLGAVGRAVLPAAFPPPQPQPAPQPTPQPAPQAQPQPDLTSAAQNFQAVQAADGQPGSGPQPDLYSGAKVPPAQAPDYNSTVPLGGPRAAPVTPPGPARDSVTADPTVRGILSRQQDPSTVQTGGGGSDYVPFAANNPLNMRFAGQGGAVNTRGFAAFATPADGKAATDAQFARYADRGIGTLQGLISTWAPPSENDTNGYIATVSKLTGIAPNQPINLKDPSVADVIQQAMAKVEGNKNANAGSVQFAGPGVPSGAQGRLAVAQQASGGRSVDAQADNIGVNADEIRGIAEKLGYKPASSMTGPGDSLLATGMAMMGGRTFADSMANGSKALLASRQQQIGAQEGDNRNALGVANTGVAMANTAANRRLQMAQFALQNDKLEQQIKYQNDALGLRAGQLGVAQERVGDTTKRTDAALNGTAAQNSTLGKKAGESIDELNSSAGADATALASLQSARKIATTDSAGLLGPTPQAQIKRAAAMFGLGDTATLQAYEKMSAANRMEYLQSVTGGHVGGIRSNAELENIGKAVAQASTDPKAADYILSVAQNQLEAKMAFRQAVQAHAKDPEWQGAGFSRHEGQFYNDYYASHPAPQWDNGHGTASPAGAPSISSFWK